MSEKELEISELADTSVEEDETFVLAGCGIGCSGTGK